MDDKEIKAKQGCLKGFSIVFIGLIIIMLFFVIADYLNKCSDKKSVFRFETNTPDNVNNTLVPKIDKMTQKQIDEENRRKEIFAVDGANFQHIVEIVSKKYPSDLKKQFEYQEQLEKNYRKWIEKKYKLKKGELDSIIIEGQENGWKGN